MDTENAKKEQKCYEHYTHGAFLRRELKKASILTRVPVDHDRKLL
jgi:hypothetical protein